MMEVDARRFAVAFPLLIELATVLNLRRRAAAEQRDSGDGDEDEDDAGKTNPAPERFPPPPSPSRLCSFCDLSIWFVT